MTREVPKGDSRLVPLSREAVTTFREALEHHLERGVPSPLIFFGEPDKDGTRRPYTIGKVWADTMKRAGIEDLRFHDLRHEAVSRLVEAGLTDQQVAAISGHRATSSIDR